MLIGKNKTNTMKANRTKVTPSLTDDLMMAVTSDDFDIDKGTFKKCLDILQDLGFIEKRVSKGTTYIKPIASKIIEVYKPLKGSRVNKRR